VKKSKNIRSKKTIATAVATGKKVMLFSQYYVNSDMQVKTVNVELSIAKSHYVGYMYLYACHYLQNIITVPKFKLFDLEKFNTK
jgi:hypothetical protein